MHRLLPLSLAAAMLACGPVLGAELNIVSGGAVEPGVTAVVALFRTESGADVKVRFATAPAIRHQVGGEAVDVVIAPPAVIDALAEAGKLDGKARAEVGRVGVGAVVRDGAPKPDISSTEALKRALLDAPSVVYNRASTGIYLEKLFDRLGVSAAVRAKETRFPDGASVIEHVIHGDGNAIGFGAITEIGLYRGKGAQYVGPLPYDAQNYTRYAAAPAVTPADGVDAAAFLKFLGSPAARAAFLANGVE